jgi:hypothetical protein
VARAGAARYDWLGAISAHKQINLRCHSELRLDRICDALPRAAGAASGIATTPRSDLIESSIFLASIRL